MAGAPEPPRSLATERQRPSAERILAITPTYTRAFQELHLARLASTIRLVAAPFFWIVVESTQKVRTNASSAAPVGWPSWCRSALRADHGSTLRLCFVCSLPHVFHYDTHITTCEHDLAPKLQPRGPSSTNSAAASSAFPSSSGVQAHSVAATLLLQTQDLSMLAQAHSLHALPPSCPCADKQNSCNSGTLS